MELPQNWAEYARLQALSSRNSIIDSYSWGTEEEMNLFLDDPDTYTPTQQRRLERAQSAAARRERSRASIRKSHQGELASQPVNVTAQLEAREALARFESSVTAAQWNLISAVARGEDYSDISLQQGISVGAARAQMFRLRREFVALAPGA